MLGRFMTRRLAALALFALLAIAALAPIRAYDAFWHLASGRWIVEHHALPTTDPFAIASEKKAWINGEWLYEVAMYATSGGSDTAISIVNALVVAAIFTLGFLVASQSAEWGIALFAACIAFAGGFDRLGVRPSTVAALLAAVAIALLSSRTINAKKLAILYALLTIAWINTHPSALLAPLLALVSLQVDRRRWIVAPASTLALLINPFGLRAITAPFELTSAIRSGAFVNAEWLPSPVVVFPLFYLTIAAGLALFAISDERRENVWRFVLFLLFAALAARYVRNQGLYFATLPLLVPLPKRGARMWAIASLIPIAWALANGVHGVGVDAERFPVHATARLKALHLPGNIYNADQFGGYLIWSFYPERRVVTDGRNELYRTFIDEDGRARRDSRAWRGLLQKYLVDLAVAEYETERVTVVDVASGEQRALPASLVRYRRRDWALIAFDDAAMVFARRAAFPAGVLERIEYKHLVPDDPAIEYLNPTAAKYELLRAKKEMGEGNVVGAIERAITARSVN
jgi:hypothetical protein